MAGKDPLTNLPNRKLLIDRATQAVAFAKRNKLKLSIIFIDLDGFKEINDTHGHSAGDCVLKTIAERISSNNNVNLSRLTNNLLNVINKEVTYKNIGLSVSASMGVACYPQDGEDFDQLLNHADEAMYQSKRAGKNTVTFYSPEINKE